MVEESVPTAQGIGTAIDSAMYLLSTWDPTIAPRLDMGRVAPDVVPTDRLR
jgi:hypothetical protein